MGYVLGQKDGRIELSKEALFTDFDIVKLEVNRYLDKCRLLGLEIESREFHVQLSEKSYMNLNCDKGLSTYYIRDNTRVVLDKHSKDTQIHTEVQDISIDAQKYTDIVFNDTHFRKVHIYSEYKSINLKLKVAYQLSVRFFAIERLNVELEGIKDLYNSVQLTSLAYFKAKINIKKVENVLVSSADTQERSLSISPEEAEEFVKLCKGAYMYKLVQDIRGNTKRQLIKVKASEVTNLELRGLQHEPNGDFVFHIRVGRLTYVDVKVEKIVNFLYKVQGNIKKIELE